METDPLGSVSRSKLHFILIADCSGSMNATGKIEALNNAIHESIPAIRQAQRSNAFAQMLVRAVRFSGGASWHIAHPTPVESFEWVDLSAAGVTDLGAALRLLSTELTPEKRRRRALPPVVVLLSDGAPTDDWERALEDFNATGWGRPGRTVRVAIAIGRDAEKDVLTRFTGNPEAVFEADNAQRLTDLIKWASVTVSRFASSGASQIGGDRAPGTPAPLPPPPVPVEDDLDDDEPW